MDPITLESRLVRNENLLTGRVDDEFLMMSVESGKYYHLNRTAGRIWELLESPRTAREICDCLRGQFKVAPEVCQREVLAFLSRLAQQAIVLVS